MKNDSDADELFSGFCIDLLKEISVRVGFSYVIQEVSDGKYGAKINNVWNGLIGELVDRVRDCHRNICNPLFSSYH